MSNIVWVRFEAHHGGGHMGHTVEYKPFIYGFEMSENDLQCELEDWSQQFRNVKSTAEFVDHLPENIIEKKIKEHTHGIEYHKTILDSLKQD